MRTTKKVLKIIMKPYNMPVTFPIHDITSSLDYDFATIGDNKYMLPMKSVLTSKRLAQMSRNDIEFRLYRKFGTESTIKFDTPEALPEDQTKEKPVEGTPTAASTVASSSAMLSAVGPDDLDFSVAGWAPALEHALGN